MNIKKLLSGIKYKLEYRVNKLYSSTLCGINLRTIPGTIRKQVDQDDTWFFYLAKHHNTIFDIGCNVGYTALLALIQNPSKPYLLVDPNPRALNNAHLNLVANNLGYKALYFSGFVSDKLNEKIRFYTIGVGSAGSMYASHAKSAASINSFTKVQTVTLDYLYQFYKLKPDLVKIDVEGAENLVMDGAFNVAKEAQCTFFIEMHKVKSIGMKKSAQFMLDWCSKTGYRAWYLKTGKELKVAETIKNRGKCHLLLLPNTVSYPAYLMNIKQYAPLPKLKD